MILVGNEWFNKVLQVRRPSIKISLMMSPQAHVWIKTHCRDQDGGSRDIFLPVRSSGSPKCNL